MSTSRSFRVSEDDMKRFKPWNENNAFISNRRSCDNLRIELLVKCMDDNSEVDTNQLINFIRGRIELLESYISEQVKFNVYKLYNEDKDHILTIYGYHDQYTSDEVEDEKTSTIESLVLFAKVIKCDNYFDTNSNFFEFKSEIKDRILCLIDVFYDAALHDIMEQLKDKELTDDDFDDFGNLKEINQNNTITFDSLD